MFGETGREALLPICIAPEAADCDPTDAKQNAIVSSVRFRCRQAIRHR